MTHSIEDSVKLVSDIKVKTFVYKSDPEKIKRVGFIADELQEVAPFAVVGNRDAVDSEGNPVYQHIKYAALVPDLVATLQWCIEKINTLEKQISNKENI
jgi:hypothetical protein